MDTIISPSEAFQNDLLRPILKSQNELLIVIFRHYLNRYKSNFERFSPEDQAKYIEHSIRKDLKFRSLLLGTIIGKLTSEQYVAYSIDEEELNRRTINMLIQRLQSQLVELQ
ncbi:MAG: glyoxalase [Spirosomataceae bacterium]